MSALKKIYVLSRDAGLDEETRRDLYEQVTGKRSAKAMSEKERLKVVAALKNKTGHASNTQTHLNGKYAKKLQALWIAAYNLGVVHDRRDSALIAFVKRQTSIDHVRFVHDQQHADKVIEALKAMLTREAGVTWVEGRNMEKWRRCDAYKIAFAQHRILEPDWSGTQRFESFWTVVKMAADKPDLNAITRNDWIKVMNKWGKLIRLRKTEQRGR